MLDFWIFLRHLTWSTWLRALQSAGQQRLPGLAAEMAYNGILALFPAILALTAAIGLFDPPRTVFRQFANNLAQVAPPEVMGLIDGFVIEVSQKGSQSVLSLGFLGAIWAASSAIHVAMVAMDQIHQVHPTQQRPFWKTRSLSILLMLATIGSLLLAAFILSVSYWTVQTLASQIGMLELTLLRFWQALSHPIALGLMALAFSFVYRWGPSRWLQGTPIFPGAILAALFWAALSVGFRVYLGHFGDFNRAYGALGAVIILLLWLYLGSLAMLFGNQLNVTVGKTWEVSRSRRAVFPQSLNPNPLHDATLGPTSGTRQRQNPRQNRKTRQNRQQQSWGEPQNPYASQYPDEYGQGEADDE